jgi:superfamily II DNA or RNA helicase
MLMGDSFDWRQKPTASGSPISSTPTSAVSASRIEALPHQITAVYGEMLPRQPLRFLLADDPGAGKTIMAGLLIKELLIRGDLERCLIVAPGNLVEQWQDEMAEKFGLGFDPLTRDQVESSITGNPFVERSRLIARLDMLARSDELRAKLDAAPDWDLIICDEAHRMAASYFGGEVKETQRYKLGKLLGTRTRNLLLMSATPHNGKEADFQLFMGLLDADRFEGRFREGIHKADVSDMMRRLIKEELYHFDGTPLFPERRAYTASYSLSPAEADLYQAVTTYVREEMNRADRVGDNSRRNNVGFALQILQRRLASSPAAIHRSLERRRKRLEERLREEKLMRQAGSAPLARTPALPSYDPDEMDDAPGVEAEAVEEQILDSATAAQTIAELEAEIEILRDLEERALRLKLSGRDAKWRELESILDDPIMLDPATGLRRKIIIFTEPKDTLEYLAQKISGKSGAEAVVVIHGGIAREARRAGIAAFNSDPVVRVMIANDAAGEGVNLQRGAHLMVNYDLPWNPNRLEQRFGRIHRIGQTEVCHLWNLCAANTREGEVYRRLLEKLEEARAALGGKVYDVLGELFEGQALRDLLIDAIRYGDSPEIKAELFRKVDGAVDTEAIERLVVERKLTSEGMDLSTVAAIREQMERAQARCLQPHFISAFFREAFALLGGRAVEREKGRFEILRAPSILKDRDRLIGRGDPVLDRYARVTFDKTLIIGQPQAELVAPGHPLLDAAVDVVLERFQPLLQQGGVLVDDDDDDGTAPRLLVYLEHAVRDGRAVRSGKPRAISQRLQFVHLTEDGAALDGGPAPYLDCRPITQEERPLVNDAITASWLSEGVENRALGYAIATLVPEHLAEVKHRRLVEIDKVEREVRSRLTREINYWDARAARLREEERAGKEQRINASNAEATAQRLVERLHKRQAELDRERRIVALPPVLRGAVLIVPKGFLQDRTVPSEAPKATGFAKDAAAREVIERLAMDAVIAVERRLGNVSRDVSGEKKGWDIESHDPVSGHLRFIEVKAGTLPHEM